MKHTSDALVEAAAAAMAQAPVRKAPRCRAMTVRVVEEVAAAFNALAAEKGLTPVELHRQVIYAYLDEEASRRLAERFVRGSVGRRVRSMIPRSADSWHAVPR